MTLVINKERPRQLQVFKEGFHPNMEKIMEQLFEKTEIQRLSKLVENNPYHDFENVLEHLQSVFINCQELLSLDFIKSPELKKRYKLYLSQKIDEKGKYQRKDLLLIASGIHDAGKGVEKQPDKKENTIALGHEHAGAMISPSILAGTDLTLLEIAAVQSMVDWHDTYSETYCNANLTKTLHEDAKKIRERQPMFCIELLFHILSDNWGAEIYKQWRDYFMQELLQTDLLLPKE